MRHCGSSAANRVKADNTDDKSSQPSLSSLFLRCCPGPYPSPPRRGSQARNIEQSQGGAGPWSWLIGVDFRQILTKAHAQRRLDREGPMDSSSRALKGVLVGFYLGGGTPPGWGCPPGGAENVGPAREAEWEGSKKFVVRTGGSESCAERTECPEAAQRAEGLFPAHSALQFFDALALGPDRMARRDDHLLQGPLRPPRRLRSKVLRHLSQMAKAMARPKHR